MYSIKTELFDQIGEDIYVWHNFLSDRECDDIVNKIEQIDDSKWYGDYGHSQSALTDLDPDFFIENKINNILQDNHYLGGKISYAVRMPQGQSWPEHTDDYEFKEIIELSTNYVDGMPFSLEKVIAAGIIIYFNDFDGGSLFYTNQNIEYKPQKGDLVIHSAGEVCRHYVTELKSDKRYTHSNHIYTYIKVPQNISI